MVEVDVCETVVLTWGRVDVVEEIVVGVDVLLVDAVLVDAVVRGIVVVAI